MKKFILFDHTIFLHQRNGGISKYICELNKYLNKNKERSVIFSPISINENLDQINHHVINFVSLKKIPKFCTKIFYLINDVLTLFYIIYRKPDIIHLTFYNNFLIKFIKLPIVLSIYDLTHEKLKNKIKSFKKKDLLIIAKKIICISKQTKKDLLKFYKVDPKKLNVIYLGVDQKKKIRKNKENIITYVGARDGYKNFKLFILAFSKSKYLMKNYKIKCFGYKNFSNDEKILFGKLKIQQNIEHLYGNEKQLEDLYIKSKLLVYPSLHEGFGLPPLEAMRCGLPVAASNIACLKEILGDSVIYFDPKKISNIKNQLEKVLKSNILQKKLIKKGYKKIQKYKWLKCVNETEKIYRSVI